MKWKFTPWNEDHLRVGVQRGVHDDVVFLGQGKIGQGLGFRLGERFPSDVDAGARMPRAALLAPLEVEVAVSVDTGAEASGHRFAADGAAEFLQDRVVQVRVLFEASQTAVGFFHLRFKVNFLID